MLGGRVLYAVSMLGLGGCGFILGLDSFEESVEATGGGGDAGGPVDGDGGEAAGHGGSAGSAGAGGGLASAYPEAVLADSPVGYWRLGEDGGLALNQIDGQALSGVPTGVAFGQSGALAGDRDGAYGFEGMAPSVVQVVDDGSLTFDEQAAFSLEVWFRAVQPAGGLVTRFDVPSRGYALRLEAGALTFVREAIDGGETVVDFVSFALPEGSAGVYHHAVGTFDGASMHLYLDGEDVAVLSEVVVSLTGGFVSVAFGAEPDGSGSYFEGDLDEVAIYDRALPAAHVYAHFCAGMPADPRCASGN